MPTSPSPRRGAKPSPAPPPRRLWPYLLAIFGVAVLAVAISALPASMVTHFLPVTVHAEDFSGSVWHGSAGRIAVAAHDAGALEWRLHPGALLHMRVAAELHWVKGGFVVDGTAEVDRGTLLASHLEGGGPIEDLRDLGLAPGWRGIAKIQVEQLKAGLSSDAPSLKAAVGTIGVSNLASAQVAGGADLGGYLLRFADPAITPDSEAERRTHRHRGTARRGCDDTFRRQGAQRHAVRHHQGTRRCAGGAARAIGQSRAAAPTGCARTSSGGSRIHPLANVTRITDLPHDAVNVRAHTLEVSK